MPDSSQAISSGCCLRLVIEIKAKKQDLTVLVRPGQANTEDTFLRRLRAVALAGAKETDSTQAGAACDFRMGRTVLAQIEPGAVRRGLGGLARLETCAPAGGNACWRAKR